MNKSNKKTSKHLTHTEKPLLDKAFFNFNELENFNSFPFSLPIIKTLKEILFPTPVTFFVGENGSGKSTILEALALNAGFGPEGGSKNIFFKTSKEKNYTATESLAEKIRLSWRKKPHDGYFFRAESFFNIANYLDSLDDAYKTFAPYGGKSLHEQSHGESFLAFFKNRMGTNGFFILDEPEAALSPERQLSLLVIINNLCTTSNTQFIIATHSPLLLAFPNATIYSCDAAELTTITYTETNHYKLTKNFLNNTAYYLHHLLNTDSSGEN